MAGPPRRRCSGAVLVLLAIACAWPSPGDAQLPGPQPELRLDVLDGGSGIGTLVHGGAGITRALSMYVRAGLLAGAGPSRHGSSGRAEAVVRFDTDPLRARRWALYGAAGGGVLWASRGEPYMLVLLGLESRGDGGRWAPAVEAGLGRGVRAAVVLRREPGAQR